MNVKQVVPTMFLGALGILGIWWLVFNTKTAHVPATTLPNNQLLALESVQEDGTTKHFFQYNGERVSPWHDIPLKCSDEEADVFLFVVEIPRG